MGVVFVEDVFGYLVYGFDLFFGFGNYDDGVCCVIVYYFYVFWEFWDGKNGGIWRCFDYIIGDVVDNCFESMFYCFWFGSCYVCYVEWGEGSVVFKFWFCIGMGGWCLDFNKVFKVSKVFLSNIGFVVG